MNTNSWRRLIAGAFAVTLLGAGVVPAQAAPDPAEPARAGAAWLAGELTGGLMHYDAFGGYDDYGLSLDAYFALEAADVNDPAQAAIIKAIGNHLGSYISGDAFGDPGSTYAGATAKTLVAVQTAGQKGTSFGGVDLVDRLEDVTDDATGEIADVSTFGNYANVLGQSFAVQALTTAGSPEKDKARDFLLLQQCNDGSFRLGFTGTCTPDTDATANAVIAMLEARSQGLTGLGGAIDDAVAWLAGSQASDGSFGGGVSTSAANTNSTGLAGRALGLTGHTSAAAKAAAWIVDLQATSSSGALAGDAGAVALNPEAFATGEADGITDAALQEWRRSTPSAVLGLLQLGHAGATRTVTKIPKPVVRKVTKTRTVVVSSPAPAVAGSKGSAGTLGAYLAEHLSNGDHVEIKQEGETLVDYDLTADTILGLRLLGQQGASSKRATAFLLDDKSVDAYAHGAPYEKKASYAAPLAKLIIAGVLAGEGENKMVMGLAEELAGLQNADGGFDDVGKYADASTGTARQSLISVAMLMSDRPEAEAAVKRLIDGQCKDGGFPAHLAVDCAEGDPTATGWALQAINAVDADDRPANAALDEPAAGWDDSRDTVITDAVAYLQGVVRVDGTVADDAGGVDVQTTSAATAGRQAVGLDGRIAARTLGGLQLDDGGFAAKGDKPDLALSTAVAAGIGANSWLGVRASGLVGGWTLPFGETSAAAAPASSSSAPDDKDDALTVSRPVAYSVAGLAGLLALGALGLGTRRLVRKPA